MALIRTPELPATLTIVTPPDGGITDFVFGPEDVPRDADPAVQAAWLGRTVARAALLDSLDGDLDTAQKYATDYDPAFIPEVQTQTHDAMSTWTDDEAVITIGRAGGAIYRLADAFRPLMERGPGATMRGQMNWGNGTERQDFEYEHSREPRHGQSDSVKLRSVFTEGPATIKYTAGLDVTTGNRLVITNLGYDVKMTSGGDRSLTVEGARSTFNAGTFEEIGKRSTPSLLTIAEELPKGLWTPTQPRA